ncbi:MAG: YceH family protein [Amphritea sp.]|nr:YceH family protein [Amphritea sp.]MBQ0784944.1 YceH family protein [Amphritea sp.]
MDMDLSLLQTRVIACLIEKEVTTPDQYPLTLNSLTTACNQKSNREPVMSLSDTDVQDVIDELNKKHMIRQEGSFGSRVPKFKHRFCNTEFSELKLSAQELAIICTLFLRGPQTPGELRSRTNRLCSFSDVHETEATLQKMSEREEFPLVVRMPREPGKRESRYAHLFSGEVEAADPSEYSPPAVRASASNDAIAALEHRVSELEKIIADLQEKLGE